MMDPVSTAVVTILGKYAIDKGVELAKEAGPKAVDVAEKLLERVTERFRKNPADAQNLERFEKQPEKYTAPVEDSLDKYLKDADFAFEIKKLLAQYQAAAPADAPAATIISQIAGDHSIQIGEARDIKIDR